MSLLHSSALQSALVRQSDADICAGPLSQRKSVLLQDCFCCLSFACLTLLWASL